MSVYRMEDYRIMYRVGRAENTGTYEITRIGTSRAVTRYIGEYKTQAGIFKPEKWKEICLKCVEESESQDLLQRIINHCRENCLWLKKDAEREEYALDILIGRVYRHWKDFSIDGLSEKTVFVFDFSREDIA